jgi:hypothetical protein
LIFFLTLPKVCSTSFIFNHHQPPPTTTVVAPNHCEPHHLRRPPTTTSADDNEDERGHHHHNEMMNRGGAHQRGLKTLQVCFYPFFFRLIILTDNILLATCTKGDGSTTTTPTSNIAMPKPQRHIATSPSHSLPPPRDHHQQDNERDTYASQVPWAQMTVYLVMYVFFSYLSIY